MTTPGSVPLGALASAGRAGHPLMVQMDERGRVIVTAPDAPGWRAVPRTTAELASALREGWTEASIATYARRRDEPYDLEQHDLAAQAEAEQGRQLEVGADTSAMAVSAVVTSTGRRQSTTTYLPEEWRVLDDGRAVSPTNRVYGANTQTARRIKAKQAGMGVGTRP